jgi:hypothetical protein
MAAKSQSDIKAWGPGGLGWGKDLLKPSLRAACNKGQNQNTVKVKSQEEGPSPRLPVAEAGRGRAKQEKTQPAV